MRAGAATRSRSGAADLHKRGLFALVAANAASQLGNVVAVVALPWFVLTTTGSAAKTGIAAFATTLPLAVGAIAGSTVVDRIGVWRASITADVGAAMLIAAIPLLQELDALSFWLLVLVAFLASACEAPGRAARRAILPELAEQARLPLERANAISTTSEHTGYVVGAPIAGILIATIGAPGALWVDAATFVASAMCVAALVPRVGVSLGPTRFVEGLQFVLRTPLVRTFFLIWTIGGFFIAPLASVLLPVYARTELNGAGSLAACVTAYGVGGLAGTLAFGVLGPRVPRRPFYVSMWLVYPALSSLLIPLPPLVPVVALLFAIGFIAGAYDPFEVTIHQELIPAQLRARAFAILLASEMIVVPVSMLVYGLVLDAGGVRAGVVMFAIGNALLGAYAVANRPARSL